MTSPISEWHALTREELRVWREVHEYVKQLRAYHRADYWALLDDHVESPRQHVALTRTEEVDSAMKVAGLDPAEWRDFVEHVIDRM